MRNTLRTIIGLGVLVICAAPRPAWGQNERQDMVRGYLDRASVPVTNDGFTASGEAISGALAAAESQATSLEMEGGKEYTLIAVCDDSCGDLDLEVYDAAGNEVDSDLEYDDVPVVNVTPVGTSSYRVIVGMIDCSSEPCAYAVRVFSRPATSPSEHHQVVEQQLVAFGEEMSNQGFQRTHGLRFSALDQGQSYSFLVRLKAGTTYGIAGFCDRDCSDLDLAIFADGDDPVAQDVETDDHPALEIEVTSTGVFRIRVSMPACSSGPCVYGVALHGQPTKN